MAPKALQGSLQENNEDFWFASRGSGDQLTGPQRVEIHVPWGYNQFPEELG